MQQSRTDGSHPLLWGGVLVAVILAGSTHSNSQSVTSTRVIPPIQTKGSAQAAVIGLTPAQIRHAYGFDAITNQKQGAGQTIAVIEAFGDHSIEQDLARFDQTFDLPPCTASNGCLRLLTTSGKNLSTSQIWSLETALDVEWAHAIAPQATIMVVESPSDSLNDMLQAVDFAVSQGATVVSMSWGGKEFAGENALDSHFLASNVSFVASSGDFGAGVMYPAVSPYVLSVGGTSLILLDSSGTYGGEVAWSGSGGGQSGFGREPAYQRAFPIPLDSAGVRGNPDVAYDADPNTGFAVFSSGWNQVGGSSAGAPQWSALIALAKSMGWSPAALTGTNAAIYAAGTSRFSSRNYHDVTAGSNGTCGTLCMALRGYDYVTGLGSPQANNLINSLVNAH